MSMRESIDLTIASLQAYGPRYKHWAIAFSGGKDSSSVATLVPHLIETGQVPAPETLTVLYADTRMELIPLWVSARGIMAELEERGIRTQVVIPSLDDRFFVYMFGRGVPPPKNRFRWCTAQIKIEPMERALASLRAEYGEKFLMLTGVRLGESAARDERIITSCSRDGAECGQGWFQTSTPEHVADTLAPILHWRVCMVWAWLTAHAPGYGFPTRPIATAYGGDEAGEINCRTGCIGCPLASRDVALRAVIAQPGWEYLAPLTRLKPLYEELSFEHRHRIRKAGVELKKDGTPAKNPQRVGPLTMAARQYGLSVVMDVQAEVNAAAERLGRPKIDILNAEEEDRIYELIAANTWPDGWDGTEPVGDALLDRVFRDGSVQPLLGEAEVAFR
jgi:DNA sulfur modification protein DndC